MNGLIMAGVFVLGGLAGVVLLVLPLMRQGAGAKPGTFKIKKNLYTYEVGDMLIRFVGQDVFCGIDVHLTKRLPHIFIDAYGDEHPEPPENYLSDGDVRMYFKGEIDKHVTAYVEKSFNNIAHKIFSDEVLDAIVNAKYRYDIEVMDRHLRLIVPTEVPIVAQDVEMQHDLLKLAKTITEKIDQVLENWDETKLDRTTKQD